MIVIWLLACQAASACSFQLCQETCCSNEFCGPVEEKTMCSTEAMMCGFTGLPEPPEAITAPKPFPNATIVEEEEPKLSPRSQPVLYHDSAQLPPKSLPSPPPVPPPQSFSCSL